MYTHIHTYIQAAHVIRTQIHSSSSYHGLVFTDAYIFINTLHTHIYIYTHVFINILHIYSHIYIYIYTGSTCVVDTNPHIIELSRAHDGRIYIHKQIHTKHYTHTYTYIHIYTHTYTYIHMYTDSTCVADPKPHIIELSWAHVHRRIYINQQIHTNTLHTRTYTYIHMSIGTTCVADPKPHII